MARVRIPSEFNAVRGSGDVDLSSTPVAPAAPAASESPAFCSHWWAWTAAGVVVAGAGVGIYGICPPEAVTNWGQKALENPDQGNIESTLSMSCEVIV